MESKELAIRLARALDAKKGYNIRILHVENLTTVTDYFCLLYTSPSPRDA